MFSGKEIILNISGYDPRDLISGHYLSYSIDYGVETTCDYNNQSCICYSSLSPPEGTFLTDSDCADLKCIAVIKGKCSYSTFNTGIERYYISEVESKELDTKLRKEGAKIRVILPENGSALVKEIIWD